MQVGSNEEEDEAGDAGTIIKGTGGSSVGRSVALMVRPRVAVHWRWDEREMSDKNANEQRRRFTII